MTAPLTYTLGRFVWRELFTPDVAGAKRFYGSLFGWTSEDRPMGPDWSYTLWKIGEKQIGGMMDLAHLPEGDEHIPPHWDVYVSVADVDQAAQQVVDEGGRLLSECRDIPDVGRFAVAMDPEGGCFNLFRAAAGDPEDGMPGPYEFCWESLGAVQPAKAAAFYQKVVGWGTATMGQGEDQMTLFTRPGDGEAIQVASMGAAPAGSRASWLTFVGVEKVTDTTAKCRELGGKVLVERTEIPDVGAFAILEDPFGAVLGVFEPKLA